MSIVRCTKCDAVLDIDYDVEDIVSWDPVICSRCDQADKRAKRDALSRHEAVFLIMLVIVLVTAVGIFGQLR